MEIQKGDNMDDDINKYKPIKNSKNIIKNKCNLTDQLFDYSIKASEFLKQNLSIQEFEFIKKYDHKKDNLIEDIKKGCHIQKILNDLISLYARDIHSRNFYKDLLLPIVKYHERINYHMIKYDIRV